MNAPGSCLSCQAPLGGGARDTLCPRCLLLRASAPTELATEEPGSIPAEDRDFGDYELLEQIAQGGMGVVYKARQKSLDRVVAIKLLLLGPLANADYLKRFRFEAVAAGGLRHPNIVHIHEVGLRDGQPFIVMEYVEGQNLAKLVGGRPLSAKRAATYLKTIAEAIHAAHESGILHRDLKPSNVMIDFVDQPRVTDFGLAKKLEGDSELTLSGQSLGTPNYMPPEQAVSKRGKVGRASDVYGLGGDLLSPADGAPTARRGDGGGDDPADIELGAGEAAAVESVGTGGCGDDLPEVPGEGLGEAVHDSVGAGGGPGAVPGR